MIEKNDISIKLQELLEKKPDKAERFELSEDFFVDFVQFNDRPYEGANSIISNGVSSYCETSPFEFIITFNSASLDVSTDLFAFLATYIQLYFFKKHSNMTERDYFSVPGKLIDGYDYKWVYSTYPVYFPRNIFSNIEPVIFLWLIPIFQNEFDFISKNGADTLEKYLVDNDPDMSIFNRVPLAFK